MKKKKIHGKAGKKVTFIDRSEILKYRVVIEDDQKPQEKSYWASKNSSGRWARSVLFSTTIYYFEHEDDAAAFKLTWS